jgi:regulator of sigma E protease
MQLLTNLWHYVAIPALMLTVLVFVHEFGHYWIARRNRVRIDTFSIGFGPELFGRTDRAGTRWRVGAIPLGGYVKMFGDADGSSRPDEGRVSTMSEAERAVSFHHKTLAQRAAVIVAGPAANFLFAILVLAGLFMTIGQPHTPAVIDQVIPDSAAAAAGLQPGDRIVELEGRGISRFEDVQQVVLGSVGVPLSLVVERDHERVTLTVTPRQKHLVDRFGNQHDIGVIGVTRGGEEYQRHGPISAVGAAVGETWDLSVGTLKSVWEMIIGLRSSDELGGPIGIAQMSGQVAQVGFVPLIWLAAVLSINLGLINLFPIPLLDGGHLLFYAVEGLRGRPIGDRVRDYSFRIGLALVLSLMVFATRNDLFRMTWLVDLVRNLMS